MNQALYAHMNNKRKMKKEKENSAFTCICISLHHLERNTTMNDILHFQG
jgi:hypothetical protein